MKLKNKVAIVTGGSRGIGYATVEAFLREGATVILAASSQATAGQAVAKLQEKYPQATVAGISPDLSSLESVRSIFRETTQKYGCIDILVNNAGVSERTPFIEYTEEAFDKVMDLNVKGVFNATKAACECMIARGKGVILSTSSMVSIYGQPSGIAYPASKFAAQWPHGISGARTRAERHSRQRRRTRHHRDRYDESRAQRSHRADDCTNSAAPPGTARGYRKRLCISRVR